MVPVRGLRFANGKVVHEYKISFVFIPKKCLFQDLSDFKIMSNVDYKLRASSVDCFLNASHQSGISYNSTTNLAATFSQWSTTNVTRLLALFCRKNDFFSSVAWKPRSRAIMPLQETSTISVYKALTTSNPSCFVAFWAFCAIFERVCFLFISSNLLVLVTVPITTKERLLKIPFQEKIGTTWDLEGKKNQFFLYIIVKKKLIFKVILLKVKKRHLCASDYLYD